MPPIPRPDGGGTSWRAKVPKSGLQGKTYKGTWIYASLVAGIIICADSRFISHFVQWVCSYIPNISGLRLVLTISVFAVRKCLRLH